MSARLSEVFLGAARAEVAPALRGRPDLEARLSAIVAAARRAWPAFEVSEVDFIAHLAARVADVASVEEPEGHADLYLAFAYLVGLPPAVAEVQRRVRDQARRAARRLHLKANEADDLEQQVLAAVLVGEAGVPGISRYSGQGPLDAWLAATAFRIGLRGRERERRESPDGRAEEVADGWEQADPELDFIKKRYREQFDAAFRSALGGLSPREKNVLRLHLLGGLNIERIGTCYGVHRATVARWIASAREKLLADTRGALARSLSLQESEVDSLVGLLQSQVDVSLTNYLAISHE